MNMFDQLKSIYQDKKIFLTGHTGFKGSWMLKLLSMLGAEVKGYSLAPKNNFDLFNLIKADKCCSSTIADVRNKDLLKKDINDFQPDIIFHLAAQPLVRLSYQIPLETFEVNAIGTANLLEAVRVLNKQCSVILITTDKVYHNNEWVYPYRENDRLGGYDPYSASKACAELIIDSYRNSFFNPAKNSQHQKGIAVARAGNVIGGGDWSKDRLIPDIINALSINETIIIRNPAAIRPWQHVLEPLSGYLILAAKLMENAIEYSQAYNFGPYSSGDFTVENMVKQAIDFWGSGKYTIAQSEFTLHEAGLLKLDINKVISEVGWKPVLSASQALFYTLEWYKQYIQDPTEINSYTEMQIKQIL